MSTVPRRMTEELEGRDAVPGSELVGRVDRDGVAAPCELGVEGCRPELRDRVGDELIDRLLAGARTQEEIVGPVRGNRRPPIVRARRASTSACGRGPIALQVPTPSRRRVGMTTRGRGRAGCRLG